MRALSVLAVAFAVGSSIGCSTSTVMSAAPSAEPGWRYVVGQQGGHPAAWVCPENPGQGECRQVDVLEEER